MSDQQSAELTPLFTREQSENGFRTALNLFVGRGKRYSSLQLEKASGVSHRRIDCFRSYASGHPDFRPLDAGAMLSIISVVGPELTSEWLKPANQVAFAIPEEMDHDEYEKDAREWLRLKGEAHHPLSPEGRELSASERNVLSFCAARMSASL